VDITLWCGPKLDFTILHPAPVKSIFLSFQWFQFLQNTSSHSNFLGFARCSFCVWSTFLSNLWVLWQLSYCYYSYCCCYNLIYEMNLLHAPLLSGAHYALVWVKNPLSAPPCLFRQPIQPSVTLVHCCNNGNQVHYGLTTLLLNTTVAGLTPFKQKRYKSTVPLTHGHQWSKLTWTTLLELHSTPKCTHSQFSNLNFHVSEGTMATWSKESHFLRRKHITGHWQTYEDSYLLGVTSWSMIPVCMILTSITILHIFIFRK
jgi:hypothetical protein